MPKKAALRPATAEPRKDQKKVGFKTENKLAF
jgi:hypothetical protein